MTQSDTRLSELEGKVAALSEQNARLLAMIEGPSRAPDAAGERSAPTEAGDLSDPAGGDEGGGLDRRSALRGLGTAAAAAVGLVAANGLVRPSPAAAADGDPIIIGSVFNNADSNTRLNADVAASGTSSASGFSVWNQAAAATGEQAIALRGRSNGNARSIGVLGMSDTGTAVQGDTTDDEGVAVRGTSSSDNGIGVYGEVVGQTTGNDAVGVRGRVTGAGAGVLGTAASGQGVSGTATGGRGLSGAASNGVGVYGESTGGETAPGAGIVAASTNGAALRLQPSSLTMPPTTNAQWAQGSLAFGDGALWLCLASGTGSNARWVRLSTTFVPLDQPRRVYRSDQAEGPLSRGQTRDVDMTAGGHVPASASAVLLNATVAGTVGGGFLTLYPKGESAPDTASVNYADGQVVGNNATVGLTDGELTALVDGGPASNQAQIFLDVYGYYA